MKKIVLASLLKPVSDTRMYEKLGKSLAKIPNTEIHIIGQKIEKCPQNSAIFFHPIFSFKRLSKERIIAPFQVFQQLKKIRPAVFIMGTHELLWTGFFYKLFFGAKIIYNVEENYLKNTWFTNAFPMILRPLLVMYIFCKEWFCSFFIDEFWLAEKSYQQELSFLLGKKNHQLLENKYQGSIYQKKIQKPFYQFLYTGTIAENYGIFDCIDFIEKLHQENPMVHLTIVGFCANTHTLNDLERKIKNKKYIQLIGGQELVPHTTIINYIQKADCGIIAYQKNPSTDTCIPTKLYEYIANSLPIISVQNSIWQSLIEEYQAGFCIDFSIKPSDFFKKITTTDFYTKPIDEQILWKNEEEKLLKKPLTNLL